MQTNLLVEIGKRMNIKISEFYIYLKYLFRIGDTYSAARYYFNGIQQRPNDKKLFMSLIACLIELKWYDEAKSWLELFQKQFPYEDCKEKVAYVKMCCRWTDEKKPDECLLNENIFVTKQEKELRADSRDFELRFIGHCNTTTDIKEVNYLGKNSFRILCNF